MKNVKTGDDGAEREAIVAWLRSDERKLLVEMPEVEVSMWSNEPGVGLLTWVETQKPKRLPTASDFADAIERGDHLAVRSHIIGEDK